MRRPRKMEEITARDRATVEAFAQALADNSHLPMPQRAAAVDEQMRVQLEDLEEPKRHAFGRIIHGPDLVHPLWEPVRNVRMAHSNDGETWHWSQCRNEVSSNGSTKNEPRIQVRALFSLDTVVHPWHMWVEDGIREGAERWLVLLDVNGLPQKLRVLISSVGIGNDLQGITPGHLLREVEFVGLGPPELVDFPEVQDG